MTIHSESAWPKINSEGKSSGKRKMIPDRNNRKVQYNLVKERPINNSLYYFF